jgi:hypothetical protein
MVSIFNRLNTRKYRDHNEDSGLIRDRGQIKDKGQIKDRDQLEVFPIDGGKMLRYGVTIKQHRAGKRPEIIKEGDFINIIEKKYVRYVVEGRPYDRSFYSIDDTKFKTGAVKSIVEVGAPWPDEDGKREHQKMKIVLTNIDLAKEIFKGKVPRYVIPNIEGFSEEHIEIDDAYEPSHYYTRAILSGRRKRKRRTRKVKRSNKPKKKHPKKTPKKTPQKKP